MVTSPKRKYDSSRRQVQARETRHNIIEAARALFIERGYTGATIDAIAQQAGVALKTVYAVFENKRSILVAVLNISSSNTGEGEIPVLERSGPQAVKRETNQRRQIQMFARVIAGNLEGAAVIDEIIRVAAKTEPDIDQLGRRLNQQRWDNMAVAVRVFQSRGALQGALDEKRATDIVWVLTSPEVFLLATRERGWSKEEYADWLSDTLIKVLLPAEK